VLVRELVHASRDMWGLANPVPTKLRYKNEEEFLAIVATNVYLAVNRGTATLRSDYSALGALQPPYNTSRGFLRDEEHRELLEHYSKFWQPTFGKLGKVKSAFNPFGEF
jgi:hypothetical protein